MSHARRTAILVLALIGLAIPTTSAKATPLPERSVFHGLVMPVGYYKRLSQCEVGRNKDGSYRWDHHTRSYTSGFGIYKGTWRRWSNSSDARRYTPRQQAIVADRIAWKGFTDSDGKYVWPVGPWGWAVVKSNCMGLKTMVCQSRHPLVQKWKYRCK
jgi:hypothetical protein